jgi:hypothetical protein
MPAQSNSADGTTATVPSASAARSAGRLAAASLVGAGSLAMALSVVFPSAASASTHPAAAQPARVGCAVVPSKCGYPDGTNTGVPRGTTLRSVPGQVSHGRGWHFEAADDTVEVTGRGAVLSDLYIRCNLDITASDVTVKDVRVVTSARFGISLRHTTGVTIENSTVRGRNVGAGRVDYAIDDVYADSTGMTIKNNNISRDRTAVQVTTGLVSGNYIHDFGYIAGDHTNGVFDAGSTGYLTIRHNTILDNLSETDAISLDASFSGSRVANKIVVNNLLGGGGYAIYGGDSLGNATSHIVIERNRFSQLDYAKGGQYGAAGYYDSQSAGNRWTGNVWDSTGRAVTAP